MPKETINGFQMYYEVSGDGFPVAFIHGGFGGIASTLAPEPGLWVEPFAQRYRVIIYDRRSTGRSDYPDDGYSLENFARDARELLNHLGIERSHVIGASAGGPIAITYAVTYPEAVEALALVNTAPRLIAEGPPTDGLRDRVAFLEREGAQAAYEVRRSQPAMGLETVLTDIVKNATPEQIAEFVQRRELLQRRIKDTTREDRIRWYAGETRNYSAYVDSDLSDRLAEIAVPAFIIHGDADSVVPVAGAHQLHEGIPNSDLRILPGAQHGLMAGNNEEAWQAMLDFFVRTDGGS
jgi:pimeloyl-ACP methyl ester carboxylesterase